MERLRRRTIDGPACKGTYETGSEEDGKDAEVLGGVVNGNTFVTRTEGILDERAEVVRQWHVLRRRTNAGDENEGTGVDASRGLDATCWRATTLRSPGYGRVWAPSARVILSRLISR